MSVYILIKAQSWYSVSFLTSNHFIYWSCVCGWTWSLPTLASLVNWLATGIPGLCLPRIGVKATVALACFLHWLWAQNSSLLANIVSTLSIQPSLWVKFNFYLELLLIVCVHVCLCVGVYTSGQVPLEVSRGWYITQRWSVGVAGDCEQVDAGNGNQSQVLCESDTLS